MLSSAAVKRSVAGVAVVLCYHSNTSTKLLDNASNIVCDPRSTSYVLSVIQGRL